MIWCAREKPMPRGKPLPKPDHTTLQMALVGYEIEKERIAGKIREIQSQLGAGKAAGGWAAAKSEAAPKKRVLDRKSTRLNSSHLGISYAVFCLKKKNPIDCDVSRGPSANELKIQARLWLLE